MEAPIISGVTHDISEAKVTIFRVPDRPGIAAKLFRALADENVNVDMIEQNVSTDGHTDISFTVPRDELTRTMEIVDKVVVEIDAGGANFDDAIGRVSVVGAGMKTNPGVAAQMFETLATEDVNIEMISTSTIRISCVVHEDDVERAVRALHAAFELEARRRDGHERSEWSGPPASSAPRCCGCSRSAAFPVDELRAYASPRSEGRALPFGDRRGHVRGARRRLLRRPRPRRHRRRRSARARVGAHARPRAARASSTTPPRSAWTRRPARGERGQPRRRARPARRASCRVPTAPRWCSSPRWRRCTAPPASSAWWCPRTSRSRVPGSPACTSSTSSGRRARARWTATPGRDRCRALLAARRRVGPPDRRQRDPARRVGEGRRLHERGVEARAREPQDPPRARAPRHRHLRARAGLRRPRHDRQRAVRAAALAGRRRRRSCVDAPGVQLVDGGDGPPRRSRAPASTRCSSVGCARTRRRPNTLDLWVTGDNLRKGAALNAVQLAELLLDSSSPGRSGPARVGRRLVAVHADQARHQRDEEDLPDERLERHQRRARCWCPR